MRIPNGELTQRYEETAMKREKAILYLIFILACIACVDGMAQKKDSMARWWEARVNERQPPDTVLKTIGIRPGMIVGEVGAGGGRYTVEIASRIGPSGRVYANDIDKAALAHLEKRCRLLGLTNVEIVQGTVTDPKLPEASLEMVIMVNVVHCLEKPVVLLKNISGSLKPDGMIVIVEGNLDKAPDAAGEWYSREKLLGIYRDAGYILVREETFLPKDNIYFLKENRASL